ncbi:MAG: hypothetical protein MZW92_78140 [Comamonadaceae bacterium]|nr:hypothetical protein [Comamonadaceae bacterium]
MKTKLILPGCCRALLAVARRSPSSPSSSRTSASRAFSAPRPGTVFSYLPVKVGDTHDRRQGRRRRSRRCSPPASSRTCASRSRATCWWCIVEERPAIAQIDFVGVKEFDKDDAQEGPEGRRARRSRASSTASLLDKAEQELKRQYLSRGRYAVADHHHGDAAGAQPGGASTSTSTKARSPRSGRSTSSATRRSTRSELLERVRADDAGLAHLVHQERPVLAGRSSPADLETLRSLLPRTAATSSSTSTRPRSPSRRTSEDIYITISVTEGEQVHGLRRQAGRRSDRAGGASCAS